MTLCSASLNVAFSHFDAEALNDQSQLHRYGSGLIFLKPFHAQGHK